jgi:hypothetical protein
MHRTNRRQVVLDVRKLEKMKEKDERRIDMLKRELITINNLLEKCRQDLALKEVKPCLTSIKTEETY